jgi:hypothetical protein
VRHQAVICMLDGAVWQGTVEAGDKDDDSVPVWSGMVSDDDGLIFESNDGEQRCSIELQLVKSIYFGTWVETELQSSPRFFDSAPIPSSLWVRIAFADGEIVEGMIANGWSSINGPLIELLIPGQQIDKRQILIPRSSIAEMRVITTR